MAEPEEGTRFDGVAAQVASLCADALEVAYRKGAIDAVRSFIAEGLHEKSREAALWARIAELEHGRPVVGRLPLEQGDIVFVPERASRTLGGCIGYVDRTEGRVTRIGVILPKTYGPEAWEHNPEAFARAMTAELRPIGSTATAVMREHLAGAAGELIALSETVGQGETRERLLALSDRLARAGGGAPDPESA